jgi:HK97 gp10 family phage protein
VAGKAVAITGIREIDRKLARLEPAIQRKVLRQSIRAALKPIAAAVKARIDSITGALKKAVKVRAIKSKRRGSIGLEVRISGEDANKGKPIISEAGWFSPAFPEFGTAHEPAQPIMRPVYDSQGPAARDHAMREILDRTIAEAKKG